MNVNIPVPTVPQLQPGAVPQLADLGSAAKALHTQCAVNVLVNAGAPPIPDAVVGQGVTNTAQLLAGGFAQQIADLLQPGLNQAVQQAVDHAMQPVQQALQLLREQLVRSDNLTKRLHNRTIGVHVGADVPLMAPCKERHPPPPAAGAAAGAAAAFGALPPPGMFPATLAAFFELSHVQLSALAAFYEEDFGPQNMPLAQRRDLLRSFIFGV